MKYLYLLLFVFISCKNEAHFSFIGKWKVVGPQDTETNTDIEYTKDQFRLIELNNKSETFNYRQEGNMQISHKVGSTIFDTAIVQIINNDSLVLSTPTGIYCSIVRYKD